MCPVPEQADDGVVLIDGQVMHELLQTLLIPLMWRQVEHQVRQLVLLQSNSRFAGDHQQLFLEAFLDHDVDLVLDDWPERLKETIGLQRGLLDPFAMIDRDGHVCTPLSVDGVDHVDRLFFIGDPHGVVFRLCRERLPES